MTRRTAKVVSIACAAGIPAAGMSGGLALANENWLWFAVCLAVIGVGSALIPMSYWRLYGSQEP